MERGRLGAACGRSDALLLQRMPNGDMLEAHDESRDRGLVELLGYRSRWLAGGFVAADEDAAARGVSVLLLVGGGGLEVLVVLGDELTASGVVFRERVAIGDDFRDGERTHGDVEVFASDRHWGIVDADVLIVDEVGGLEFSLDDGAEDEAGIRIEK